MTERSRIGLPFVVAAPSGTGKTTVCRACVQRDPRLEFSISHTTRAPREGERSGIDYNFVSPAEFRSMVEAAAFLEHASYGGENYGTSIEALRIPMEDRGHDVLLEIEVQGAAQLRDRRRDARFIFLLPPSMKVLEQRLRGRGTDSADAIDRRLGVADRELEAIRFFDYAVVNDELERTISAVLEIISAEREGSQAAVEAARARHARESVHTAWLSGGGARRD
ncbi:MAG: guanylate kinase [Myxococcota bacterium]|nr:guanylate kinase [Myxococcota bacterium]